MRESPQAHYPVRPAKTGQRTLSVIVPSRDAFSGLSRLFPSISRQSTPEVETIVVDTRGTARTRALVESAGAHLEVAPLDRSDARNRGAELAQSNRLLFVDSDMTLSDGVLGSVIRALEIYDAVYLKEFTVAGPGYLARARAVERRAYSETRLYSAARGFRRSVFQSLRGYDASLTGLEDMDLQARLLEGGWSLGYVSTPLIHNEQSVSTREYLRKRAVYGRADRKFLTRHPSRGRELLSPRLRAGFLASYFLSDAQRAEARYIPGVVAVRIAELLARAVAQGNHQFGDSVGT